MRIFRQNPALLLGLTFFLGLLFALQTPWALLPALLLLCATPKRVFLLATLLFILPLPLVQYLYPQAPKYVEQSFKIRSVRACASHFSKGWVYHGRVGRTPCSLFSKTPLKLNHTYHVKGEMKKRKGIFYSLKLAEPAMEGKKHFSTLPFRHALHNKIKKLFHAKIKDAQSCAFLTGISLGSTDNLPLKKSMTEAGLSHLMAISGFHFALIAFLFHLLLQLFLPRKKEMIALMVLLTLYLLVVGTSPSVVRAWIFAMLFLSGQLANWESRPLNTLGLAALVILLFDPKAALTLSFQLSFLATAAILLFYQPLDRALQWWIPKAKFSYLVTRGKKEKVLYIAGAVFRSCLALTLSVHILLLPMLLYTFHSFSLHSLVYNLVFPTLTSVALFFLMIALFVQVIVPPLGYLLFSFLTLYTQGILSLIGKVPEWTLYTDKVSIGCLTTVLCALASVGILLQSSDRKEVW